MFEGQTIGQYKLLRKIGEGGMGAVYLGEHAIVGRRAAIKVLLPELSARRDIVDRFFNEARAMTAVSDPGIVQMFDFGYHTNGSAYIVMELLEGETLDQRLKRCHLLMPAEALRIVRQTAGSLAAAHARGIVHRDLKPENIFMVRDPEAIGGERPKILDFGIAKLGANAGGRNVTVAGSVMGTPTYMSPEQCRGVGNIDPRSDVYSLGCVLFHLLAARPPFAYEGMGELFAAHMNEAPTPPSRFVANMPPGVDEVVLRCLAKRQDDRFQSMAELQQACDHLLARISQSGASAPTIGLAVPLPSGFRSVTPGTGTAAIPHTQPPPQKPTTLSAATGQTGASVPRRRTGLWIGLGVGLIGGVVAIAVVAGGGSSAKPEPAAEQPAPAKQPDPPKPTPPPTPPPEPPKPVETKVVTPTAPPDAGVDAATVAKKPPDAGTSTSTTKTKTTTSKTKQPTKPQEDLYDDR